MSRESARALSAVIVDDEVLSRRAIKLALRARGDVDVVGEAASVAEAVARGTDLSPDLLLLDVQLPDGDGFDVLRGLAGRADPAVVMVTAFDAHAIRAFEHQAIDYVLKPFTDARVRQAVDRAVRDREQRTAAERTLALERALAQVGGGGPAGFARRLLVKSSGASMFVDVPSIDWLEASANYVTLHVGKQTFLVRGPLTAVLASLDPAEFVRIHRSRAVQIRRIREIQPWFTGDFIAVLHDGQRLRVSRHYRDELLKPSR
jgi:two-component system LytT family response regulator